MAGPPAQAWTRQDAAAGEYRHFQVVLQGGRGSNRWVELAAVLNPQHRERVSFVDLRNPSQWRSGWHQIVEQESDAG